jgi:hypothetical protein
MEPIISVKTRVARLLLDGHSTITFILGLAALLISAGFVFSTPVIGEQSYVLLTNLIPFNVWGILFYSYGVLKVVLSLYRTPYVIKLVTILTGLWLWSYLVMSFVIVSDMTLPIKFMLITPILCEVWDFSMTIFSRRYHVNKRKSHA